MFIMIPTPSFFYISEFPFRINSINIINVNKYIYYGFASVQFRVCYNCIHIFVYLFDLVCILSRLSGSITIFVHKI